MAAELRPLAYLDVHSGEFSLFYYRRAGDPDRDASEPLLQALREQSCRNCRVKDVAELGINGQAFQFMKYAEGVRFSSLLEVYGGYKAGLKQNEICLPIFNPLTPRQLQYYRWKWVGAIAGYLQLVDEAYAGGG